MQKLYMLLTFKNILYILKIYLEKITHFEMHFHVIFLSFL